MKVHEESNCTRWILGGEDRNAETGHWLVGDPLPDAVEGGSGIHQLRLPFHPFNPPQPIQKPS